VLAQLSVWARCSWCHCSCSSKSRLVVPSWFYLSGTGSSG